MGSTPDFRRAFVARLKQACDESKLIPLPGQGRQQMIADRLKTTAEAVSKWFKGVSMPKPDKMTMLAELLEVDQSWLAYGINPEMDRAERRIHGRESDGAVHLVLGMIMLSGGHCGQPMETDPRSEYVDFYTTMRGAVYPMRVSLAREISRDHYEVLVPKEYKDVRSIGVMPAGPGKYHFIDMPLAMIDEHKVRKAGSFMLPISQVETGKYTTGRDVWPRIKSFGELA
jgi:transcriptional regulator with XRE-family HTH domain